MSLKVSWCPQCPLVSLPGSSKALRPALHPAQQPLPVEAQGSPHSQRRHGWSSLGPAQNALLTDLQHGCHLLSAEVGRQRIGKVWEVRPHASSVVNGCHVTSLRFLVPSGR